MLLGFGYLYKFVMFYFFFFCFVFKKQKIIDQKKASCPKFCNIIFLFLLLKIGSVGPVDQRINLVSPKPNILKVIIICEINYSR